MSDKDFGADLDAIARQFIARMTRANEMLEDLGVPFLAHALEERQGGSGKMFTYVATETVIRFLNTTVKVWDFEITSHTIIGDVLVVFGKLTIPGLGTRSGTGVQKLVGGEDTIKGAASDCLKKCATLFGVALDLYGPDLLAGEVRDARQTPPNGAGRVQPAAPSRRTGTSVNTVPVDPDDYDEPDDPGIVSWKAFWDHANAYGYKFKTPLEAAMKHPLGADPAYALERFQAWVKDTAQQKVLV